MTAPKVSIITRTRNRDLFLRRAAESVLGQQDAPGWEWIVVNDGGDREPVEAVMGKAVKAYPDSIHLLHLPASKGMEHASNKGIELASGEFLVIHDDDDSWDPGFLPQMVSWLDRPERAHYAGVVCHAIEVKETVENGQIKFLEERPFNSWLTEVDPWRLLEENPFPPISFLFRRSAYDTAGPFDEELPVLGDWEFNVRVILRWPIGILAEPLARYHHRPPGAPGPEANTITAGERDHLHWEKVLRQRWKEAAPAPGLPCLGQLAAAAGAVHRARKAATRTLSLPIRPGPQV
jgi:glycosyltransferase involved in cell wall biosynthesis